MSAVVQPLPRPPEPTDLEVIAQVIAGDRGRFALLVQRHNQPVFRACRAVLRSHEDAEDAVQAAWLSAYRALATFRGDAAFRTWMTRIAVNEASARLRQRRKLALVTTEENLMSAPDRPDADLYTKELTHLLEREIDALPEALRTVLVLRDVVELDTAETATALAITEENVRVRLHRARQALAAQLAAMVSEQASAAMPQLWQFDGERCARMLARVMAAIEPG